MGTEYANARTRILAGPVLLVLFAYLVVILAAPQLGPIDDHELLATIEAGKWLPFYIGPGNGRFYPLDAQELNIVAFISTAPFAFYLVNAIELILVAALFYDINCRIAGGVASLLALLLLFLTPGFASAWTRLQIPERDSLFFFVLFLWCYGYYAYTGSRVQFAGALIAANLALYYKEPGFLMLGVFAAARLAFVRKKADQSTRTLDLLLLASALFFVLVYYAVIYRHRGPGIYGAVPFDRLLIVMRNLSVYATSDSLVILFLPLLGLWRLYRVTHRKAVIEPMADALLLGALAYLPVFFVLKLLAAPHYLLPAYAFALPAVLGHWRKRVPSERLFWNITIGAILFFTVAGAAPWAFYLASFNKYVAYNNTAAVAFLASDIAARPNRTSVIYLDGVDPERSREIYVSFDRYLLAARLQPQSFTIRHLPNWHTTEASPGDYLVITPFDTENLDAEQLDAIGRSWRIVWHSTSRLAVPNLSLHVLLKYVALRYVLPQNGVEIGSSQSFTYPVDYEIFIKP